MTSPSEKAPTALAGTRLNKNWPKVSWLCRRLHGDIGECLQIHVHTGARRPDVNEKQGQEESDRRHYLKVNQRFNRNAADLPGFANTGDAVHDRTENDWRHEHPHEFNEEIAQRLPRIGAFGPRVADDYAQHHRKQDLDGEMFVPGTRARRRRDLAGLCAVRHCSLAIAELAGAVFRASIFLYFPASAG